jgi:hypothetical protein
MLRFTTTALAALVISFPLSAFAAGTAVDQKAPEAAVVAAASEDAVVLPAPRVEPAQDVAPARSERPGRLTAHGSSQSAADYRFTSPYAFPQQTLPITFPSLAVFNF